MNGILYHFWVTLKLNFRNRQALVMGYVVPIFFLVAFGSMFGEKGSRMTQELGKVLTVSTLGGACFGLPVALVSERERGVWRRYRLTPVSTAALAASSVFARYLMVLSSGMLQVALSMLIYGMNFPKHPFSLLLAFTLTAYAFLGLGLIIAALAKTPSAVQALGQMIFLPMTIIGGVGYKLELLPAWAKTVATFLPGKYAVESMTKCTGPNSPGLENAKFHLLALFITGTAAFLAGSRLFKWDAGQALPKSAKWWVLLAMVSWLAVGGSAYYWGIK